MARLRETLWICYADEEMDMASILTKPLCTVVGVGPGVSMAVARRFGLAGHRLALVARNAEAVSKFARELEATGIEAHGFTGDASDETSLRRAFEDIHASLGTTEVLVYNAFAFHQANPSELPPAELVDDLRVNVVGALISAQSVISRMKGLKRGTILFTGGGLALEPEPGVSSLAIGKAAMRSLAFSLHKELIAFHIHIATVTICGAVKEKTRFSPDNIAESFFQLHQQPEGQWDRESIYQ
jgi:NAD(P)-dependent dehydrogenase (short-subunit alcohol dehydrogenase family)